MFEYNKSSLFHIYDAPLLLSVGRLVSIYETTELHSPTGPFVFHTSCTLVVRLTLLVAKGESEQFFSTRTIMRSVSKV